jgi:alcohol dehydrogenase (cytochrome c)
VLWRKFTIPAPGEPGSETWKGATNAWQTGGGAVWVTGTYDPDTNQTIWGTGNPVPMFDPTYRPGDNLYTNSTISWDPDSGNMNWYFQFTPGDMWDYDEVGTHIMIDSTVAGQPRKLVTHSARNLPLYDGPLQRPDAGGKALYGRQLDEGHRPEDRQAHRL